MTVRELIEQLQALPGAALEAEATIDVDEFQDYNTIESVNYQYGMVVITPSCRVEEHPEDDDFDDDDEDDE